MKLLQSFQIFKELSKSGIVTLVLISVFAGYLIGRPAELPLDGTRLALTLIGMLLLASGSSALNQVQERKLDALMPRTQSRPLPSGRLSLRTAVIFVSLFVILGFITLSFVSKEVLILGILALISYNGLYTLWWKRHWAFAAVPGAIPGALPILMGYTAASHQVFQAGGAYLFFILFFWQMPHFWTLAIKYREDYAKAGFPTLPVKLGPSLTVKHIVLWCLAYVGVAMMGPLFLRVGLIYFIPSFGISVLLLIKLVAYAKEPEGRQWLQFFLWVNLSLIVYLGAAVLDLWSIFWTRP